MFETQMRAQGVYTAVGRRAVGAKGPLGSVRVEVMPAVGDLLAARLAPPQGGALGGRYEHAVIRVLRRRHLRPLCNQRACPSPRRSLISRLNT
ncbi:unnamed protein product [Pieris brassicae]|uniref:Uncharacterized protein n=1 Tax=Pieris brassicae TaxID=7116 RepID=A0A9P0SQE6_PIEBR|nr:unnamed protein product [Pieris brassicae]